MRVPTNPVQINHFSTSKNLHTNTSLVSENEVAKVDFVNGLVKVTLKLPARGELCEFNLKLLNDSVATLIENLKLEDKSIEKAQVFSRDGVRISQNTPISAIVLNSFVIKINETSYNLDPPSIFARDSMTEQDLELKSRNELEEIKRIVSKLYLHLNVEHFEAKREQQIIRELEILKTDIEPMEKVNLNIRIGMLILLIYCKMK